MKAHKQPFRPRPQDRPMDNTSSNTSPQSDTADDPADNLIIEASPAMEVDVGKAMPPSGASYLPVLQTSMLPTDLADGLESGETRSMLAEGMHFVGNAVLRGPCSVAGEVEGNLAQATGALVSVVVTETGRVKGDITAQKISVMGHTNGVLDSGEGEVALHDTASVHGLVRYGRIQVNGADLNATLERVAMKKPGA